MGATYKAGKPSLGSSYSSTSTLMVLGWSSGSLSLPKDVDSESVKAKYTRGILHIHITKLPEAQPKTISVEVEE